MSNRGAEIEARVAEAAHSGAALYIVGGDTKRHLAGRDCDGDSLSIAGHNGVVDYQPGELVLTARAGTPLTQLQATLAAQGQCLPFEPPAFDGRATLGGTLACNLNGPGRPWRGSIRDAVLGVTLVNGKGETLRFGGSVMKNVAGYDISRLQAGALGTLGVILEVSLKVLPLPELSVTLQREMGIEEAIATMNRRATEPKPLSGAAWIDGELYVRLSGAESAVRHTAQLWGGDQVTAGATPWDALKDMQLPFFEGDAPLWRLSMNASSPATDSFGAMLVDWGGAQRWVRGDPHVESLQRYAGHAGGHATLFRGGDRGGEVRSPLSAVEQRLQKRLKQSFDPAGVLNPGRLYSWM
ncbi:MAG: glycolate oxidase subunit GlcE [Halioglobus sp.]|nr:glycolate oxidase subunit GlcE [Halioglobus sp.]